MNLTGISQKQIDILASFCEAASELQDEPFLNKDEPRGYSICGEKVTFRFGDRFHLKSALVPFRRIWMPNEPSYWIEITKLIRKYDAHFFLNHHEDSINAIIANCVHPFSLNYSTKDLINLWLNTVFAHGGIKGSTKRSDFEKMINDFGHGPVECAFREAVWKICIEIININNLCVRPLLIESEMNLGLKPSFKLNYAFGRASTEFPRLNETIERISSTKYSPVESFQQRVQRIMKRQEFSTLFFLLKNPIENNINCIDIFTLNLGLKELFLKLNFKYEEVELITERIEQNARMRTGVLIRSDSGFSLEPLIIDDDNKLILTKRGAEELGKALNRFYKTLGSDA